MCIRDSIGGGTANKIDGSANWGTIAGGCFNALSGSYGFIGGGETNTIKSSHSRAAIVTSDITSVSGCMLHTNALYIKNLPTADPGVDGVIWNSSGTLKISMCN